MEYKLNSDSTLLLSLVEFSMTGASYTPDFFDFMYDQLF